MEYVIELLQEELAEKVKELGYIELTYHDEKLSSEKRTMKYLKMNWKRVLK